MKVWAYALLGLVILIGNVAAKACDTPGAVGTSRTLAVSSKAVAGVGHGYPALGLARGEIILTFDDGPMPYTTPRILDILAHECIEATFFMVGKRAEARPEIAASVRAAGHSIGSHSYTHADLSKLPDEAAVEDIQRGYEAVEKAAFGSVIADRPRLVRFPDYRSTPGLVAFVHSRNGVVVNGNISAQDWRGQPANVSLDRVKKLFDRGNDRGILVLHDSQKNTVDLLPMLIAELKARHMRIVHLVAE